VTSDQGEIGRGLRLAYFAGAMLLGMLVTATIVLPHPAAVALAPLFPEGLFFFLHKKQQPLLLVLLGWSVYIGLAWLLLRAASSRWFAAVFLVLGLCLVVNVGGCKHIADNTRLPHSI
jgi:hypothetical protein